MDDFENLYRKYYRQVYYFVLNLCKNEQIAEEITQDTFFKVLQKIDFFKGECKIQVWICQIAKNTYYTYCKKHQINPEEMSEDTLADGNLVEDLLKKETAAQIHKILHSIPEPYKEVFWMRTFGELSFAEIGAIHEKTESWARVTYHRAKIMIREEMG